MARKTLEDVFDNGWKKIPDHSKVIISSLAFVLLIPFFMGEVDYLTALDFILPPFLGNLFITALLAKIIQLFSRKNLSITHVIIAIVLRVIQVLIVLILSREMLVTNTIMLFLSQYTVYLFFKNYLKR